MKKLSKLNLNRLSKAELETKQMNAIKGGGDKKCTCECECSCPKTCSCTPYPSGGISNSMSTSRGIIEFMTSSERDIDLHRTMGMTAIITNPGYDFDYGNYGGYGG